MPEALQRVSRKKYIVVIAVIELAINHFAAHA
jgi:hypothetical protein